MDPNLAIILLPESLSWFLALVIIVPGLIGLALMGYGLSLTIKGQRAKRWPTAEGIIQGSSWKQSGHGVKGRLAYKYNVKGKEYLGKKRKLIDTEVHWMISWGETSIATKYWKGRQVPVYYNPEKPSQAILEPGIKLRYVSYILIGSWVLAGGIFMGWMIAQG